MKEFILSNISANYQDFFILTVSFFLSFIAAFGRGFLMRKPPGFIYKLIDATLCGIIAVPITGTAIYDFGVSIWGSWTSAFCFGSLGFLFFHDFIKSLAPLLSRVVSKNGGTYD